MSKQKSYQDEINEAAAAYKNNKTDDQIAHEGLTEHLGGYVFKIDSKEQLKANIRETIHLTNASNNPWFLEFPGYRRYIEQLQPSHQRR